MERVLREQDPSSALTLTKYFSSPVLGKFSPHGDLSERAQAAYLRALEAQPGVEVILGHYAGRKDSALRYCKPPKSHKRVLVWKLEEKKTDVAIAVSMYRDAAQDRADQILLVTNDSDFCPVLEFIRQDFPSVRVGVLVPGREKADGSKSRTVTAHLVQHADWVRSSFTERYLSESQLPDRVRTGGKPADRPELWKIRALPSP